MDILAIFNGLEACWWITCAVVVASSKRIRDRMTKWNQIALAVSLACFGSSDIIEMRTGAWWDPPALFVYKAACVAALAACIVAAWRNWKS